MGNSAIVGGHQRCMNFTHRIDFVKSSGRMLSIPPDGYSVGCSRSTTGGGVFGNRRITGAQCNAKWLASTTLFQLVVGRIQQNNDIERFFFLALAD